MQLPQPIQTYFDADRKNDCEARAGCFAPDATVHDEGRSHAGHYAIGSGGKTRRPSIGIPPSRFEATEQDGAKVRARVTGEFPGSPATLTFAFRLAGDKIAALEIGA